MKSFFKYYLIAVLASLVIFSIIELFAWDTNQKGILQMVHSDEHWYWAYFLYFIIWLPFVCSFMKALEGASEL